MPRNKSILFALSLSAAAFSFFFFMYGAAKNEISAGADAETIPQSTVSIGNALIPVELADNQEKRKKGLSNRPSLEKDRGMLFIMPNRSLAYFWMKDMRFPLDIIWIDGDKIANIHKNLPPEGDVPANSYGSEKMVDFVLEVNAGFADKHNIRIGDKVNLNIKK